MERLFLKMLPIYYENLYSDLYSNGKITIDIYVFQLNLTHFLKKINILSTCIICKKSSLTCRLSSSNATLLSQLKIETAYSYG